MTVRRCRVAECLTEDDVELEEVADILKEEGVVDDVGDRNADRIELLLQELDVELRLGLRLPDPFQLIWSITTAGLTPVGWLPAYAVVKANGPTPTTSVNLAAGLIFAGSWPGAVFTKPDAWSRMIAMPVTVIASTWQEK